MVKEELKKILNDELYPAKQMFMTYEKLAGNGFHFSHKSFRKCVATTERIIQIIKNLIQNAQS